MPTATTLRIATALLGLLLCGAGAPRTRIDIPRGDPFPDLEFADLIVPQDYASLGLPGTGSFSLEAIPGDLLVLEFMNKHCVPCQTQVRRVQELYEELQAAGLYGRVRLLAVAAGNQARYLPRFRAKRGLTYPIAADPKLVQWQRFGEPGRTPLSLFLRRSGAHWVLVDYHFGVREARWLFTETNRLLDGGSAAPASTSAPDAPRPPREAAPDPSNEHAAAVRLLQELAGGAVPVAVLELPDSSRLYRARGDSRSPVLYARMANLDPLCEICHGVHFLYAFDAGGRVRAFEPVYLTKWGNEPWDATDVEFFRSRILGRHFSELEFDEEVDAVSRATISSTLVFLELGDIGDLLAAAKEPAPDATPGER